MSSKVAGNQEERMEDPEKTIRSKAGAHIARLFTTLDAEEASLWLLTADGKSLRSHSFTAREHTKGTLGLEVLVADSLIGLVTQLASALAFGPLDDYNRSIDRATGKDTFAMAAAPITRGEKVIGVLSAVRFRTPAAREFTGAELDLVEDAAVAIGREFGKG